MTAQDVALGARLAGAVRHNVTVTAYPRDVAPFTLAVEGESLELTFSEDWSPYIQASLACTIPADQARLDALDPRQHCRVQIVLGYTFPDGTTETFPPVDLALRTREVNRPENTLDLTLAGDEARAQDNRVMWPTTAPVTGVNEATQHLLDYALYPNTATVVSDYPAAWSPGDLADFTAVVGDDLWTAVYEVASRTGRRIYCDESRTWRITSRPANTGEVRHALAVGQAGTIISSRTGLDREDWYNAVCLRFQWTDAASGVDKEVLGNARVTAGEYSVYTAGRRVHFQDYSGRAIGLATARKIATSRLENLVTRGRSLTVSAVAAYWLRPGMTVTAALPTGPVEAHLIQAVTFSPVTGRMTITTRQPLDVTITTGE